MEVGIHSQPIMPVRGMAIASLLHASQEFDSKHLSQGMLVDRPEHFIDFFFGGEFPAGDSKNGEEVSKFVQILRIWFWVNPKNAWDFLSSQFLE